MAPLSCNEWSRILYSTLRVPIKFVWVVSRGRNAVLKVGNPTAMVTTRYWVKFFTKFCTIFSFLDVLTQALKCFSVNWYYSQDKIGKTCSSEGNYKQSLKNSGRKPEVWGKFTLFLKKYLSLGIFSVAPEGTMCPEVNSASKNEYQGFLLG